MTAKNWGVFDLDLAEQAERARHGVTRAIVPIDTDTDCPTCGEPLTVQRTDEPALIRHGGYGATRTTHRRICGGCGWSLTHTIVETRPT